MDELDRLSQLERLGQLREQGVLSQDEFEAEKAALLGASSAAASEASGGGSGKMAVVAIALVALVLVAACAAWLIFRTPSQPQQNVVGAPPQPANLALAVAAPQPSPAATPAAVTPAVGEPMLGNCHMDICSFSREVRRETVRETPAGRLLRVTLLGGSQSGASDAGPADEDVPIIWQRQPHDIFVFCSTALPAVMMRVDGRRTLQSDILDLVGPTGIPQDLVTSANIYMRICHGVDGFDALEGGTHLGYHPLPTALVERGIDIERPEDIFNYAR